MKRCYTLTISIISERACFKPLSLVWPHCPILQMFTQCLWIHFSAETKSQGHCWLLIFYLICHVQLLKWNSIVSLLSLLTCFFLWQRSSSSIPLYCHNFTVLIVKVTAFSTSHTLCKPLMITLLRYLFKVSNIPEGGSFCRSGFTSSLLSVASQTSLKFAVCTAVSWSM